MTAAPLELTDRDLDALTLHVDAEGVWVTCTSGPDEVTVGPLSCEGLAVWLAAATAAA